MFIGLLKSKWQMEVIISSITEGVIYTRVTMRTVAELSLY